MTRLDLANLAAFALALALAAYGGTGSSGRGVTVPGRAPELTAKTAPEMLPDGTRVLTDATGAKVPLVHYSRIASGTIIADRVLSDLCEPDRILGFTDHGARSSPTKHRYRGKPTIGVRASIESLLALEPDLLIVNNLVDPAYVARLREHGVRVFDLGHMRGLDTLLPQIRALGWLIGAPERAEAYARALARRMEAVAGGRPNSAPRPRALYLAIYAGHLYGGAGRTSYHDVIEHAGLVDTAAAAGFEGWPELTTEQVLALAPEVLVTKVGMAAVVCRHTGMSASPPCSGRGRLIELDGALLDDPGPPMLDATEALHEAYFGPSSAAGGLAEPRTAVQK